jgi:hypothetical protein
MPMSGEFPTVELPFCRHTVTRTKVVKEEHFIRTGDKFQIYRSAAVCY